MNITTNTTTTNDLSSNSMLISVVQDEDGSWIVSDHATDVYGHGSSLLHALCDYHAALFSVLAVLDGEPVTARLARQLRTTRWLLGLEEQPDVPYPSTHKMTLADEGNMEC